MTDSAADGAYAKTSPLLIGLALLALYTVWGSSYLFAKLALASFPPLMISGLRFYTAGSILFIFCVASGIPLPSRRQALNAFLLGLLLLAVGNGGMVIGLQYVSTGLTAISFAGIPLWTALFSGLVGNWPRPLEWVALVVGLVGVGLLTLEADFQGSLLGTVSILAAVITWALGTVLLPRVELPRGLMTPAVQMVSSGALLIVLSWSIEERMTVFPTWQAMAAIGALVIGPSLTGFTAHGFLLRQQVRPVVANSFAYVNPVVALSLGVVVLGESIQLIGIVAMCIILGAVALLGMTRKRT